MPNRAIVAIVDDDVTMRDATQDLLEAAGYSTATFSSAAGFLDSSLRGGVSCLVTDMRMQGMTGLELYQELAASGKVVPTVLVTAYLDDSVRSRARKAGIVCCLSKPFAPEELIECVRSVLART